MNPEQKPTVEQVFGMMRKTMGSIPSAIEKATAIDEGLCMSISVPEFTPSITAL